VVRYRYCSRSSSLPFELELEFILERIQHGADVAKEEVQKDAVVYCKAVKVQN